MASKWGLSYRAQTGEPRLPATWARGKSKEPTQLPEAVSKQPISAKRITEPEYPPEYIPDSGTPEYKEYEQLRDHRIRYADSAVIPVMRSTPTSVPEMDKSGSKIGTQPLPNPEPFNRPRPITTPIWLDPDRYGKFTGWNNLDFKAARKRGFYSLVMESGFTLALLGNDLAKRGQLGALEPGMRREVEATMAKYIPGYTALNIP